VKEIGVRKVLGASVFNLWRLLSKDFVLLVLISCAIASPIAWYYMTQWLKTYQFKTTIGIGIFALVALVAMLAIANPVRSLRTE
jgi:ABC-type antimicrobial peptide transport system permease subunit